MYKVKTNKVEIVIAMQNNPVSTDQIALYPKSAHNGMAADNLNDIF